MNGHDASEGQLSRDEWSHVCVRGGGAVPAHSPRSGLLGTYSAGPHAEADRAPFPLPETYSRTGAVNSASRPIMVCRRSIQSYGWRELRELNDVMPVSSVVAFTDRVKLSTGYHFVSIVEIRPSLNASNMAWRFVLITPEDDILGEVYRGRDWALVSTALVFVVSMGIAWSMATILFRPLNRIAERMYRTACLQDDDDDELPSVLHEVSVIQNAYAIMKRELDKLKSFVPMSVLAGGDDDKEEEEESERDSLIPNETPGQSQKRRDTNNEDSASQASAASSKKSIAGKAPPSALQLGSKLATKRVSVLAVNILMFHAAAKALKEHIGTMHGAVTVALLEAVRDAKGIMEHFHGDRFTVTFNAANSVSAHAKAACRAALACMAIQKSFADKETFSPAVRFTMGVMSGLATVGNMGGGDVLAPQRGRICLPRRDPPREALQGVRRGGPCRPLCRRRRLRHVPLPVRRRNPCALRRPRQPQPPQDRSRPKRHRCD